MCLSAADCWSPAESSSGCLSADWASCWALNSQAELLSGRHGCCWSRRLSLGVVFALVAVFVETVAIGVAGFLGGGLTLMRLAALVGLNLPLARTLSFVAGAVLGVVLIVWLFNWALILISSAAGASLVSSGLGAHGHAASPGLSCIVPCGRPRAIVDKSTGAFSAREAASPTDLAQSRRPQEPP